MNRTWRTISPKSALAGRAAPPTHPGRPPAFAADNQCTDRRAPSRPNVIVNLRRAIASAVSHAPVKEVAREFGISPREVDCLRTETGFPRVQTFLEIAKRNPELRVQIMAAMYGVAEAGSAHAVDKIVRAIIRGEQ